MLMMNHVAAITTQQPYHHVNNKSIVSICWGERKGHSICPHLATSPSWPSAPSSPSSGSGSTINSCSLNTPGPAAAAAAAGPLAHCCSCASTCQGSLASESCCSAWLRLLGASWVGVAGVSAYQGLERGSWQRKARTAPGWVRSLPWCSSSSSSSSWYSSSRTQSVVSQPPTSPVMLHCFARLTAAALPWGSTTHITLLVHRDESLPVHATEAPHDCADLG
jgi:hypothetical protein